MKKYKVKALKSFLSVDIGKIVKRGTILYISEERYDRLKNEKELIELIEAPSEPKQSKPRKSKQK